MDFPLVDARPTPPVTFVLHHVGQLVEAIATAAAHLVGRFGFIIESPVIEDPVQTAFVQFLRQPGAPYWMELVSPNGPESKLVRGMRKGGGLHHLCYEVDEIERACEHLRARGMLPLAEPVPAVAFPGRRICWLMDDANSLVELVERKNGPLSLASLSPGQEQSR